MLSIKKGGMFILSSPSGAGKTTLVKKISKRNKIKISISHTTRLQMREMEKIIILRQKISLETL